MGSNYLQVIEQYVVMKMKDDEMMVDVQWKMRYELVVELMAEVMEE